MYVEVLGTLKHVIIEDDNVINEEAEEAEKAEQD